MTKTNKAKVQNKYLKNISFSLFASVLSKVAGGFSSFLIARNLQPADFGIWLTMILVISYAPILLLGTVEALLKKFPFHQGRGEFKEASQIEDTVFTAIGMAASVILVIGLLLPEFFRWARIDGLTLAIRTLVISTSLSCFSGFFFYRFIAHQDFKTTGILDSIRALLNMVLLVGLSYIWGLTGAAIGFCLTEFLLCLISAILSNKNHGRVKLLFDMRAMWNAVLVGFPITAFWWIYMVQGSVDRLVSISLLGKLSTGYYGFGGSIISVLFLFPQSIGRVLYPRLNEKLGETSNERDLFRIVMLPTRFMSLIIPGLIGIMIISIPIVCRMLPKYTPGLVAAQIMFLLAFFRLLITNAINFLIATNKQYLLCLYITVSLFISALAAYGAARLGFGIEGIATTSGLSGLFLSLLVWRSVFSSMKFKLSEQLLELAKLHTPYILLIILLGLGVLAVPQFLVQTQAIVISHILLFVLIFSSVLFVLPFARKWVADIALIFRRVPNSTATHAPRQDL